MRKRAKNKAWKRNPRSTAIPRPKKRTRNEKKKLLAEKQLQSTNAPITTYKFNPHSARIYKILNTMTGVQRVLEHPKPYIPRPTKAQYNRGFFIRYFARQSNSPTAPIIEINESQFDSYAHSTEASFYVAVAVKWRIRGKWKTYKSKEDGVERKGVVQANKDSIQLAEEHLPNLSGRISNYIKFWRK